MRFALFALALTLLFMWAYSEATALPCSGVSSKYGMECGSSGSSMSAQQQIVPPPASGCALPAVLPCTLGS
jgi:hypothetical protein